MSGADFWQGGYLKPLRHKGLGNDLQTLISCAYDVCMETNQIPPSQQKRIGAIGKVATATQVTDLHWELENICNALGLTLEPSSEGFEIAAPTNHVFNTSTVEKFKCSTMNFTDHILNITHETDSGNYSAARLMKNLRNAIKMMKSNEQLFIICTDHACDYCE